MYQDWIQEKVDRSLDNAVMSGYSMDAHASEIADDLVQQDKELEGFEPSVLEPYVAEWQRMQE